jgi:hypothetical protein
MKVPVAIKICLAKMVSAWLRIAGVEEDEKGPG